MKKYIMLLMAATAMLCACTPEEKTPTNENNGGGNGYTPLERHISRTECFYDYDGEQLSYYCLYTWDGDNLTSVGLYNDIDQTLRLQYTIEWNGNKVVRTELSSHNIPSQEDAVQYYSTYHYTGNNMTSIETYGDDEKVVSEMQFEYANGKIDKIIRIGEDPLTLKLDWDNNNVSMLYLQDPYGGSLIPMYHYTYDNKKNPFNLPDCLTAEILFSRNTYVMFMAGAFGYLNLPTLGTAHRGLTMTVNNATNIQAYLGASKSDYTMIYTYDGDWPITKRVDIPNFAENAGMRFYYKD